MLHSRESVVCYFEDRTGGGKKTGTWGRLFNSLSFFLEGGKKVGRWGVLERGGGMKTGGLTLRLFGGGRNVGGRILSVLGLVGGKKVGGGK